jgi:hypothetical protein
MTFKSVSTEQQKISHLLKFNSRPIFLDKLITFLKSDKTIECSNEILGWEGVGNRQLLCFFKA